MKVLLTGTNKGFGASICAAFQERGVEVVSLNRKSSGESGGGLTTRTLKISRI